jgi:hypothetical protein
MFAAIRRRKIAGVEAFMHNDVMSNAEPPELPEERIGKMIGTIIFLAICAFMLWGYSTTFLAQLHLL